MLNKQQIEKALHLLCSAEEAKRVGWEVVGMRAALLSHAFPAHFVLRSREDAQTALKLSDADWAEYGNLILAFWQESEASGQLMIAPPKPASRGRGRKAGIDSFSTTKFGEALPLAVAQIGPLKVAELPGELAARTIQELFDLFWAAYPNKSNKNYAFNCFKRLNPTADDVQVILDDLRLRIYTKKWSDDGATYIPNPSTYINNRVWTQPIELTEFELAASVLPAKERLALFGTGRREQDSWLGSQKVLKQIPTQADLEARLGLRGRRMNDVGGGEIIDVEVKETRTIKGLSPVPSSVEVLDAEPTSMLPAIKNQHVLDPFEAEFMQALNTVQDPEKRQRIMGKDMKGRREWLSTWKTMRATSASKPAAASRAPRMVNSVPVVEKAPARLPSGPRPHARPESSDEKSPPMAKSEQPPANQRPNLFNPDSENWF